MSRRRFQPVRVLAGELDDDDDESSTFERSSDSDADVALLDSKVRRAKQRAAGEKVFGSSSDEEVELGAAQAAAAAVAESMAAAGEEEEGEEEEAGEAESAVQTLKRRRRSLRLRINRKRRNNRNVPQYWTPQYRRERVPVRHSLPALIQLFERRMQGRDLRAAAQALDALLRAHELAPSEVVRATLEVLAWRPLNPFEQYIRFLRKLAFAVQEYEPVDAYLQVQLEIGFVLLAKSQGKRRLGIAHAHFQQLAMDARLRKVAVVHAYAGLVCYFRARESRPSDHAVREMLACFRTALALDPTEAMSLLFLVRAVQEFAYHEPLPDPLATDAPESRGVKKGKRKRGDGEEEGGVGEAKRTKSGKEEASESEEEDEDGDVLMEELPVLVPPKKSERVEELPILNRAKSGKEEASESEQESPKRDGEGGVRMVKRPASRPATPHHMSSASAVRAMEREKPWLHVVKLVQEFIAAQPDEPIGHVVLARMHPDVADMTFELSDAALETFPPLATLVQNVTRLDPVNDEMWQVSKHLDSKTRASIALHRLDYLPGDTTAWAALKAGLSKSEVQMDEARARWWCNSAQHWSPKGVTSDAAGANRTCLALRGACSNLARLRGVAASTVSTEQAMLEFSDAVSQHLQPD